MRFALQRRAAAWIAVTLLAGCASQPPASALLPPVPPVRAWSGASAAPGQPLLPADWWSALPDPALPELIAAAEHDAPQVAQVLARFAQARAAVALSQADGRPQLQGSLQLSRGNTLSSSGSSGAGSSGSSGFNSPPLNSASLGVNASWELDLSGRLQHAEAAARARLDGQAADVRLTRLLLQTSVADTYISWQACLLTQSRDLASLHSAERSRGFTATRQEAGFASALELAQAQTSEGVARVTLSATSGQCSQLEASLAYLTQLDPDALDALLKRSSAAAAGHLPNAPALQPEVPASVLIHHPAVESAMRSADAAWEDLGSARSARYPSLSLSALLATTLIEVSGAHLQTNSWSLGPSLAATLFDSGRIAGNIDNAQARHAEVSAQLAQTVRDTVRDVELALRAQASAQDAEREASATVATAQSLYARSEIAQQAGRLSLFDLESVRLTLLSAQGALINAERDRSRAWIALVKACGGQAVHLAAQP